MKANPIKIAVLSTEFHPASHTDVIVSRWLEPFLNDHLYGWSAPSSRIASFYVAQRKMTSDLTNAVTARYGIPSFDSISGALTLGGDELAVDAVMLIAEHGDYPENEFHQKLYPRKEFFDQMVEVFRRSGRVVPVFFDKHLSWNTEWIEEMTSTVRALQIPFFAGSSIPFSLPESLETIPPATPFEEVVSVYCNAVESYLFHSAEFVESVVERRNSQDPGIAEIKAWEGEAVWQAVYRGEFSWELLEAACASSSAEHLAAIRTHRAARGQPVYAFQVQYRDGLKVTHFMQKDVVRKWCLGARIAGQDHLLSGTVLSSGADHYYPHFARLCRQIEDFFLTGRSPVPISRIWTTSMITAWAMQALAQPGVPLSVSESHPPVGARSGVPVRLSGLTGDRTRTQP